MPPKEGVTGRCYCGAITFTAKIAPKTVAYCHCGDCRRWTGAPVAAFAAFTLGAVVFSPSEGALLRKKPGIERRTCADCGSPLAAMFDYLPGQIYIPLGLIDQAATLQPQLHCHGDAQMPWLHISDDLPRTASSGRAMLLKK